MPKFVHVSALAASEDSPSEWLRCKAMGEAQVRNYYPDATILRPNVIYGEEDNFLNLMAKWTKIWGVIPLLGNGGNVLQPVYVDDVAECVRAAVFEEVHTGKTCSSAGPNLCRCTRRRAGLGRLAQGPPVPSPTSPAIFPTRWRRRRRTGWRARCPTLCQARGPATCSSRCRW